MSMPVEKPPKTCNEITVRVSLTFQEAPDIHTLLAMTPIRERGKLVRLALERYIKETAHPAGDVEQQIGAISAWLRSRETGGSIRVGITQPSVPKPVPDAPPRPLSEIVPASTTDNLGSAVISADASPSINRWLDS